MPPDESASLSTSDGLPAWRTLSSRIIVSDRWLTLRADTCETADGAKIDPFYVIETPDVAVGVAITTGMEFVLARQYRQGYGKVVLELPAGRIDADEDPISACRRELLEETGFSGGNARVLRIFSPNTLRYANRMHVVLIDGATRTTSPQNHPSELIETVLWPLTDAETLLFHNDFANAAHAGALASFLTYNRTAVR